MQIKIRAWDSINNRMLSWEDLLAGREFRPKMREPEKYGLELMMYTGLKDRDGQEIYEGDILKGICFFLGYEASKTDDRDYWVENIENIENEVKYKNGKFLCICFDLYSLNSTTRVVGNIYENPELMEGRNESVCSNGKVGRRFWGLGN